jgi:hypothetical protein
MKTNKQVSREMILKCHQKRDVQWDNFGTKEGEQEKEK